MIFLSVSYDIYVFYVKLNFALMTKILTSHKISRNREKVRELIQLFSLVKIPYCYRCCHYTAAVDDVGVFQFF